MTRLLVVLICALASAPADARQTEQPQEQAASAPDAVGGNPDAPAPAGPPQSNEPPDTTAEGQPDAPAPDDAPLPGSMVVSSSTPDDARAAVAPPPASTLDGVAAMLAGDYDRAADILQTITKRWPRQTDDDAAFFLAALYEQGRGLPRDPVRACALYVRSAQGQGPLGVLAGSARDTLLARLKRDQASECLLLGSVGLDHGLAPAQFQLSSGQRVRVDLVSEPSHAVAADVWNRGQVTRTTLPLPVAAGMVFFPVEHTTLDTGGGVPRRRQFIEVAAWAPMASSEWHLLWLLSEVVGADVLPVALDVLSTSRDATPPSDLDLRLRDMVTLGVNEAGEAEWALTGAGPDGRRAVVGPAAAPRTDGGYARGSNASTTPLIQ